LEQPNLGQDMQELCFNVLNRSLKSLCIVQAGDIEEDAKKIEGVINETFSNMEKLYELQYGYSPSAQDTFTWLLVGALNLAHRVVRLEQDAALQTLDLEDKLSKLLDDVSDYAVPSDSTTGYDRQPPME
jgi:hypothetical protein